MSYFKHEAQHFRDYKEFPWLEQTDLEYRAKLTELAFAKKGLKKLLKKFIAQSSNNKDVPHSVANARVISSLVNELKLQAADSSKLLTLSTEQINKAAVGIFKRNSHILRKSARSMPKDKI